MKSGSESEILKQRAYYAATASNYAAKHVVEGDEHYTALALFESFARRFEHASILDIGAGTGRGVRWVKSAFPHSRVVGIEPVPQLRQAGHASGGLRPEELIDGDATRLAYADDAFDWVIETGVLHHIRRFDQALEEMIRVARVGVLISDSNNVGQGSYFARKAKRLIKGAGLWRAVVWAQTRGKMYKESEGDGVYYSFCAFDCIPAISKKFPRIHFMNTVPSGFDLYGSASHIAIIAYR